MIQQARITVDLVKEHLQALHTSSELTRWFRRAREPQVENVTVEGVIAALHRQGVNPVLMGTHGLLSYRSQARATDDVDVLIVKKDVRKAVRILEAEYPFLEIFDNSAVTRFVNPVTQKPLIDVMKPSSRAMQLVFRHTVKIGRTHRIPELEMAIACKYIAAIAPNRRQSKRFIDVGDMIDLIETNRAVLDLVKLKRLADGVSPKGGDAIVKIVKDIDAGRIVRL